MPTTLTNGIQLPDKGSVDWYSSMQSNYNLIDTHLGNTDTHVTAEDKANWNSKQGSLSQAQLDAIAQVATNTNDIATLQSGKADASHTHSSSDITDIGDYATKQYVDNSISGLVDNAPAALDTLNELSAALNDDANFASTVTTALAAKANSADLATVATSGSYSDLTDKPTIPTNTSDLINDSNFVDTSNSAVASGITSAKVTDYDSHIADTDIHVTASDKTTWNTVTSKANDSDVVHKSENETISGNKTFSSNVNVYNSDATATTPNLYLRSSKIEISSQGNTSGDQNLTYLDKNNTAYANVKGAIQSNGSAVKIRAIAKDSSDNSVINELQMLAYTNGNKAIFPSYSDDIDLGTSSYRWKSIYATNYYYGSNNVEFSTKFVTTDTNQTISGDKVWTGTNTFQQNVTYQRTNFYHQVVNPCYILKDTELEKGSLATTHTSYPGLWQDKNNNVLGYVRFVEYSSGRQTAEFRVSNLIKNGALDPTGSEVYCAVNLELQPSGEKSLIPEQNNDINLGTATKKWKSFNGVEPSSLSLPSGNANDVIDISSYLTYLDGTANTYIAPANGWISITMNNSSGIQAYINGLWGHQVVRPSSGGVRFLMPICKNMTTNILIFGGTIGNARFIPCQGNV